MRIYNLSCFWIVFNTVLKWQLITILFIDWSTITKLKTSKQDWKKMADDNLFTEGILYDVLDKIFEYLSLKDLIRAAAVCK